jgi:hypothetical protein
MTIKKTYSDRQPNGELAPTVPTVPPPACEVADQPDGSVIITLRINDPTAMRRHRSRAGVMDLGKYLWENILKRAVVDSVY